MTQRPKRPRDANQLAKSIVDVAVGDAADETKEPADAQRRGGLKGGAMRARMLSSNERKAIAKKAAVSRWGKGSAAPVKKEKT